MAIQFRSPFVRQRQEKPQVADEKIPAAQAVITPSAKQDINPPMPGDKVFIEEIDGGFESYEYSSSPPAILDRLYSVLHGFTSRQNFIELFYSMPEVFAPVHEIASRVADCNWQLVKDWNDEVDYSDADFNRLFSTPNPLQQMKGLVYMAVVYEILCGGEFWFYNKPSTLAVAVPGTEYKNIIAWWNLASQFVTADHKKNVDPYTTTELSDFINKWTEGTYVGSRPREFDAASILPIMHLSMSRPFDFNTRVPLILGAERAIRNLIPVYEARGVIYIKRGALGFVVSKKSDDSGTRALTKKEKQEAIDDFQESYGVTNGRSPVAVTGLPVDFIRTAMSIQELQPFDETLADACAIYAVLRVPRHLVPSKDNSTFANADADLKAFYENVIIPWAKRYAEAWTNYLKIPRRYICANFDHVPILQMNRKINADTDKVTGDTMLQRWQSGVISLNDWITAVEGKPNLTLPIYTKKIFELTPEELVQASAAVNLFKKSIDPAAPGAKPDPNNPGNGGNPNNPPQK
jgi:hypothetical protein